MTDNPWDDPSLSSGEYVRFDAVGDEVEGEILDISIKTWDDGKRCPQLVLDTGDGEERILTAGQIQLKMKLVELRPAVGDRIKVTYTESEKRAGGKTLKHFDVYVTKPGKQAATPAADLPPF